MSEIARCRSCQRPIWWRLNASGKRQPMDYDLVTNHPTDMPHHATCPLVNDWRKTRSSAVVEVETGTEQPLPWYR